MDPDTLIFKIREFYLLETYQLKLYADQIPSLQDLPVIKAYEHMVELEQRHVDCFAEKLLELGVSKPEVADDTFGFAGFVSAKALDLFSLAERYKLGIAVESKAYEMYGEFIARADDKKLIQMLWHNRTDEEFHQYWFAAKLEALQKEQPEFSYV